MRYLRVVVIAVVVGVLFGLPLAGMGSRSRPGDQAPTTPDLRYQRLAEIATQLRDPKNEAAPLVTEAAKLCGFAIWSEDRVKIADPTGGPALGLAVTDAEIRGYGAMYRAGHAVALNDLLAGLDVLYKGIGAKGSCADIIKEWLRNGVFSENASAQALTQFLHYLGAQHQNGADASFGEEAQLDPIQTLFIVRVVTEEMAGPVRKSLAKLKPKVEMASLEPEQAGEAPGWAEDAFSGAVSGMWGAVSDIINGVDSVAGVESEAASARYTDRLGKANAMLSIAKFILTYTFLKGDIVVEDPGQPLVRTKDTSPGERRTLAATFRIDGTRVTDWMKDNRKLVALAGLDIDMPKTGPLKSVETAWELGQSLKYASKQLVQVVGQVDISKVKSDANGVARITLEGKPQPKALDPKKVKPLEKSIWVRVTPQVKATEMQQDLTDAVLGAIGIKSGPGLGWLTPVMECLYRMKWKGSEHMVLRIRDWQDAETIGEVTVEIHARGTDFKKDSSEVHVINRTLQISDMAMEVVGGEGMPAIPKEALDAMPPAQRQQMEETMKKMEALAKQRQFLAVGPGSVAMSVNDQYMRTWDASDCLVQLGKSTTTWVGNRSFTFGTPDAPPMPLQFRLEANLAEKKATLHLMLGIEVTRFFSEVIGRQTPRTTMNQDNVGIFEGLMLRDVKNTGQGIPVALKETEIPGENKANYFGVTSIPFSFGPDGKFQGNLTITYSVTRKLQKPK